MTNKEFAAQYRKAERKVRTIDADIRELEAMIEKTAAELEGLPSGSLISDKTGNLAAQLADLKMWRADMRLEAIRIRREVSEAIEKVEDSTSRLLLYDRYILCLKWEDVAADVTADPSYVRGRLHAKALNDLGEVRMT